MLAATIARISGMALLDSTIVNIALPSIDDDLDAGTAGLTWTVNAYTLTSAVVDPPRRGAGRPAGAQPHLPGRGGVVRRGQPDLRASRRTSSCWSRARALQGIGGALLTPGSLAILQASFRPEDRAKAIGAWSGISGVAAVAGPLLGGWLLSVASWRWVFLVNLPVAVAVIFSPGTSRRRATSRRRSTLDSPEWLLAVVGLGLLTYGLTERSPGVRRAGVAGLVAFVVNERTGHVSRCCLSTSSGRGRSAPPTS